ncbi:NADH:flavin oxidoreductase/NADH oxidase [Apiospora aurea]|uniref:NADH:flavin oxidoreductase/NADH oxidase n=1 Tax=Apiospora aurea TaxID=335848 RepID=A0ABR1QBX0_9PEZI
MAPSASTTANVPAPGVPYFTPKQDPPVGTALHPETAPTLFQPLTMRHMTLQNRFVVSPMCQYSAEDGHHTDWHFAHLSQFVLRGNALTIVEATAVTANGRITPQDSGLWKDSQIEPLRRTVTFAHSQGQKIGIQLAHAGRKASTVAPWVATHTGTASAIAPAEEGGWPDNVWAPSAIPFSETFPHPKEMTRDDIKELVQAFRDAAARAVQAGFDMIEIHGAHGYLLTSFLSPLSNRRTDEYGGSFENRTRLLFDVIQAVRDVIPSGMPLWLRISSTEWMEWAGEPSWCVQDSLRLAKMLPQAGVDLLDVSSGGNNSQQKIQISTYYQVDIAGQVREEVQKAGLKLLIGAVGFITSAEMARSIVQEKPADNGDKPPECGAIEVEQEAGLKTQADVVLMARQLLREPEFPLKCAFELGVEVKWPNQYARSNWRAHRH